MGRPKTFVGNLLNLFMLMNVFWLILIRRPFSLVSWWNRTGADMYGLLCGGHIASTRDLSRLPQGSADQMLGLFFNGNHGIPTLDPRVIIFVRWKERTRHQDYYPSLFGVARDSLCAISHRQCITHPVFEIKVIFSPVHSPMFMYYNRLKKHVHIRRTVPKIVRPMVELCAGRRVHS